MPINSARSEGTVGGVGVREEGGRISDGGRRTSYFIVQSCNGRSWRDHRQGRGAVHRNGLSDLVAVIAANVISVGALDANRFLPPSGHVLDSLYLKGRASFDLQITSRVCGGAISLVNRAGADWAVGGVGVGEQASCTGNGRFA